MFTSLKLYNRCNLNGPSWVQLLILPSTWRDKWLIGNLIKLMDSATCPVVFEIMIYKMYDTDLLQCTHRFRDPVPGVPEPVDGAVGEGRADLKDAVEVVQTLADVRHGRPLLDALHPGGHARLRDDLRHDKSRHLLRLFFNYARLAKEGGLRMYADGGRHSTMVELALWNPHSQQPWV